MLPLPISPGTQCIHLCACGVCVCAPVYVVCVHVCVHVCVRLAYAITSDTC